MRHLFWFGCCLCLGFVLCEVGCDTQQSKVCKTSVDCKSGMVCKNNTCSVCSADNECQGQSLICEKHVCRLGCRKDADCGSGETCKATLCRSGCTHDSECGTQKVCIEGACKDKCVTRADCKDDLFCAPSGVCVSCVEDAHCKNGFVCSQNTCTCPKSQECSKGVCSDLTRDPKNCAQCGIQCVHGACHDSVCQFVASSLFLGGTTTCARAKTQEVRCWGSNRHGALGNASSDEELAPIVSSAYRQATSLSLQGDTERGAGYASTCGIFADQVKCWGANEYGQLGNGLNLPSKTAVLVQGVQGASMITSGKATWYKGKPAGYHRCVLLPSSGTVKCWGSGLFGELGTGRFESSTQPKEVLHLKHVKSLSAGGGHTCALLQNGTVECWGNNAFGQLGQNSTSSTAAPIDVRGIRTATSVVSGTFHSCALLDTGSVWCWGRNTEGQVGHASKKNQLVPSAVPGVKDALSIAAGKYHTCAVLQSGRVMCWGRNLYGAMGRGSTIDQIYPPTLLDLKPVQALAIGQLHTCVIMRSDQTVRCWGQGSEGQLGNRTSDSSGTPKRVVEE